ncbi:uncharacterized protein VTP21DRAFT_7373 [Calcarisporiella thermophila]|uniref:uncharacterized protein n=1 Tax=Calcarisporiella thermophila TaxID=911321 RepID=UPI0037449FF2
MSEGTSKNQTGAQGNLFEPMPLELLIHILCFLSPADIAVVASTCKILREVVRMDLLWHEMILRRFGQAALPDKNDLESKSCLEIFKEKSKLELSIAEHFTIAHLDGYYWRIVDESDSNYNKVAQLNTVCWLDVQGCMKRVPPGKYEIIWRMRVHSIFSIVEDLELHAVPLVQDDTHPELSPPVTYSLSYEMLSYRKGHGFFDFKLPQPLYIDERHGFVDVNFSLEKKTGVWKHGLVLDTLRLRRIRTPRPEHNRAIFTQTQSEEYDRIIDTVGTIIIEGVGILARCVISVIMRVALSLLG